jgi:hypothetical protein
LNELYVDVARLPRREELFSTITGYTNVPMPLPTGGTSSGGSTNIAVELVPPSELKTVRYFIRQGEKVDPAGVEATNLEPDLQLRAGGLVRQEVARPLRTFAELSGNSQLLEQGQSLVAPEVVHVEFRYFDGQRILEVWDMREKDALPLAIEVRIWLLSPDTTVASDASTYDRANLMASAREYRQTVYPPMSTVSSWQESNGPTSD